MEPLISSWSSHTALIWACISISILVVAARIAVRLHLNTFGIDDVLMLHALAFQVISGAINQVQINYSVQTVPEILAFNLEEAYTFVASVLIALVGKASIGFQLIRVFGPTSKWRPIIVLAHLWLLAIWSAIYLPILVMPVCEESSAAKSISPKCINVSVANGLGGFYNAFNAEIDIAFSAIPISFVYKLQAGTSKKIALSLLLGLGWTAGIFTILREVASFGDTDAPLDITLVAVHLERALVIVGGSIAAIGPIFKHWTIQKGPLQPWATPTRRSEWPRSGPRSWFSLQRRAIESSAAEDLDDVERDQTNSDTLAGQRLTHQSSDAPILATNRMDIEYNEDAPWQARNVEKEGGERGQG